MSPSLQRASGGCLVDTERMARAILDVKDADAITISGGEPLEQAAPLIELLRNIRSRRSVNVLLYTGYTLDQIRHETWCDNLLELVDGIIDGPFQEFAQAGCGWRGSTNQRYFDIVQGMPRGRAHGFSPGPLSVDLGDEGELYITGIPRPGDLDAVYAHLRSLGVSVLEEA